MGQWKNVAPVVALSITAALAVTGCLAENADDDTEAAAVEQTAPIAGNEKTNEADQPCLGFAIPGPVAFVGPLAASTFFPGFSPNIFAGGSSIPGLAFNALVGCCCGGCW